MEKKKKISIIIVSYNSKNNLEKCLASVYRNISSDFLRDITIVNNDIREDLSDLLKDFSELKIINNKDNIGFGAGVNLGSRKSKGDFLFILNPDTEILSSNIHEIIAEFKHDNKIGIMGAGIFDRAGKKQNWSAGREISFYDLVRNNLGLSRSKKIWNSFKKVECDWVSGTALFIKKDLFKKIKGFDGDNFFMYFEDMDLCYRVRRIGKKVLFYPKLEVYHGQGESYDNEKLKKGHYYDSMESYFEKHSKPFSLWVTKFVRKVILKK